MNYIEIPSTGAKLFEGAVVESSKYPVTRWILRNGWYSYQGKNCRGWYISSIPSKSNVPVDFEMLKTLTVVSEGCCHSGFHPPGFNPPISPGHRPPCPPGRPGTFDYSYQVDRAFITVNTEDERDYLLRNQLVPDGKIVKVNQTSDGTKYFKWNQVTQTWDIETFGIDTSKLVSEEDFDSRLVKSISTVPEIQELIEDIASETIQWNELK